jgi:hypothetical protein
MATTRSPEPWGNNRRRVSERVETSQRYLERNVRYNIEAYSVETVDSLHELLHQDDRVENVVPLNILHLPVTIGGVTRILHVEETDWPSGESFGVESMREAIEQASIREGWGLSSDQIDHLATFAQIKEVFEGDEEDGPSQANVQLAMQLAWRCPNCAMQVMESEAVQQKRQEMEQVTDALNELNTRESDLTSTEIPRIRGEINILRQSNSLASALENATTQLGPRVANVDLSVRANGTQIQAVQDDIRNASVASCLITSTVGLRMGYSNTNDFLPKKKEKKEFVRVLGEEKARLLDNRDTYRLLGQTTLAIAKQAQRAGVPNATISSVMSPYLQGNRCEIQEFRPPINIHGIIEGWRNGFRVEHPDHYRDEIEERTEQRKEFTQELQSVQKDIASKNREILIKQRELERAQEENPTVTGRPAILAMYQRYYQNGDRDWGVTRQSEATASKSARNLYGRNDNTPEESKMVRDQTEEMLGELRRAKTRMSASEQRFFRGLISQTGYDEWTTGMQRNAEVVAQTLYALKSAIAQKHLSPRLPRIRDLMHRCTQELAQWTRINLAHTQPAAEEHAEAGEVRKEAMTQLMNEIKSPTNASRRDLESASRASQEALTNKNSLLRNRLKNGVKWALKSLWEQGVLGRSDGLLLGNYDPRTYISNIFKTIGHKGPMAEANSILGGFAKKIINPLTWPMAAGKGFKKAADVLITDSPFW